jgi:regulator of RNase E activity RraA
VKVVPVSLTFPKAICPFAVVDTTIQGDIIFCDPLEGVVVIPQSLLEDCLQLMPKLVQADDFVKADVDRGMSVSEAFKKHRG